MAKIIRSIEKIAQKIKISKRTAPLKVKGTMEKEDDTTREKNNLKRKYIQFYKMSFLEFGSPLLNYLIFQFIMHNDGAHGMRLS
jgi:hypothetical protein